MKVFSQEDIKRSALLTEEIIQEIKEKGGMIPFVRFMELALYHPEYGYYSSSTSKIGKEGDYYTSPHVHAVFGKLLARQIHEMWKLSNEPDPFYLFEFGPGHGWLAHDILTEIEKRYVKFFSNIIYVLVEKSRGMINQLERILKNFIEKGKILILSPDEFIKTKESFNGCFLSNEFFDSLPCHRVIFKGGYLKEIYVTFKGNGFREILDIPSNPFLERYIREYAIFPNEGQRLEININALKWIKIISNHLKKGFVITIDFGFEASELYAPYRNDGTLMCYFRHTASSDPYSRVGLQDITSHVNFTALISFGKKIGLDMTGFSPQYRFLLSLGLLNELSALEEKMIHENSNKIKRLIHEKLAIRRLIIPDEMGYVFKVLIQHKNIVLPKLMGFGPIPPLKWQGREWK